MEIRGHGFSPFGNENQMQIRRERSAYAVDQNDNEIRKVNPKQILNVDYAIGLGIEFLFYQSEFVNTVGGHPEGTVYYKNYSEHYGRIKGGNLSPVKNAIWDRIKYAETFPDAITDCENYKNSLLVLDSYIPLYDKPARLPDLPWADLVMDFGFRVSEKLKGKADN
jgi:hypothetical protein